MATAGVPASSMPWSARSTIICSMFCDSATANPSAVAVTAETVMTRPRPNFSLRMDAGTTHSANAPVAAETVHAAVDGVVCSSRVRMGSSA